MPAKLRIEQDSHGLTLFVTDDRNALRAWGILAVEILFGLLFLYFIKNNPLFRVFVCGLIALGIVRDFVTRMRGVDVQLTVTNLELISKGHALHYHAASIARANIHGLEYRSETGGGDSAESPSGLFVLGPGSYDLGTCVLPHIDEAQTNQAIEAVYARFPDTATTALTGPRHSDLISLNLSAH